MAAPKGNNYYLLGLDKTGRPPKYESAIELEKKIIEFFNFCEETKENITICGLALYVGFCERRNLYQYAERGEDFYHVVKRALMIIEKHYEDRLSGNTPTGAIFALKNMEWKDQSQTEYTGIPAAININVSSKENADKLEKFMSDASKLN
jgi:hypothetical protein